LRTRVFHRCERDPDQPEAGSGLGVAIVTVVVGRHGGGIGLPACKPAQPGVAPASSPALRR
jgi:K+-sensing histidine kinase KdpD